MFNHINVTLTNKCNSKCRYCYTDSTEEENIYLDDTTLFKFLKRFKNSGGKSILFTGGEALTHPKILNILEYTYDLGIECNLFTNGLLINSTNIGHLNKFVSKFLISLDGPQCIHDLNRGINGAYNHTINVLNLFKENSIDYSIQMTIDKDNINYIDYVSDIANTYSASGVKFTNMISIGRGKKCSENLRLQDLIYIKNLADKLSQKYESMYFKTNFFTADEVKELAFNNIILPVIWTDKHGDVYLYSTIENHQLCFGNIETFNFEYSSEILQNGIVLLNSVAKNMENIQVYNLFEEFDKYIEQNYKGI